MSDYLPKFKPGQAITVVTTAPVVGGQIVTAAGAPAGADSITFLGVVSRDAGTATPVGVYADGVQRVVTSAAVPLGAAVKCAANGQIAPWVDGTDSFARFVGIALEAAPAAGATIPVKFGR